MNTTTEPIIPTHLTLSQRYSYALGAMQGQTLCAFGVAALIVEPTEENVARLKDEIERLNRLSLQLTRELWPHRFES